MPAQAIAIPAVARRQALATRIVCASVCVMSRQRATPARLVRSWLPVEAVCDLHMGPATALGRLVPAPAVRRPTPLHRKARGRLDLPGLRQGLGQRLPARHAELAVDALQVAVHGSPGDDQGLGDGAAVLAPG